MTIRSKTGPSFSLFGIVRKHTLLVTNSTPWRTSQTSAEKVCGGLAPPTNYSTSESGKRVVQRALSRSGQRAERPHRRIERRSRAPGKVSQTGRQSPKATPCGARRANGDKKGHGSEAHCMPPLSTGHRPAQRSRARRPEASPRPPVTGSHQSAGATSTQ